MVWTKSTQTTVIEEDSAINVSFFYKVGQWWVKLDVLVDDGTGSGPTIKSWESPVVSTSLDGATKTTLAAALPVLLSDARTALGYTQA